MITKHRMLKQYEIKVKGCDSASGESKSTLGVVAATSGGRCSSYTALNNKHVIHGSTSSTIDFENTPDW
jgi:hypothetical protein